MDGVPVFDNSSESNQRSMRAIILCVMVAILYTQFFLAPQQKALEQQQQQALQSATQQQPTGPSAGAAGATSGALPGAAQVPQPGSAVPVAQPHPTSSEIAELPTSTIDTGVSRVSIAHLGGRIAQYKVTNYKKDLAGDEYLDLIRSGNNAALPFGLYVGQESDERVRYTLASVNGAPPAGAAADLKLAHGTEAVLEFKGTLPSGTGVVKRVTLTAGSYLFNVVVTLDRAAAGAAPVWLEWNHFFSSKEEEELRVKHSMTFLDGADKIRLVTIDSIKPGVQDFGTNKWVALGDTYFTSVIIPTVNTRNTAVGREGEVLFSRVSGTPTGGQFFAYLGPKDYKTLESVSDFHLERTVDLGWFSFLALPLLWLLRFLYQIFGNYGVAIIGLTLIVKAVMLPLSKVSFESAKKMQDLQPEIKALRERIKDPTQLNQEMFALYKRKGVNPMGGCFPVAIQIPVFLGLYNALLNALELRHSPYALWIRDLSAPESLQLFGIGVPVMVLLMAASMVYQTWTTPNPSADPTQQKMMMIMPLVFAGMFIIFPMPAGLVLYWLVNNIISIIQQLYMRSSAKGSVYMGTAVASIAIFGVGYLLTLI
jgi:YidC/Oxa1 family membrane protein insertase